MDATANDAAANDDAMSTMPTTNDAATTNDDASGSKFSTVRT
jgi:hypothetical protein